MRFHRRSISASGVYLLYSTTMAFSTGVCFTANLVYQVNVAHLTSLQLVLVGTVLEITCFIAQIPTGSFADLRGRRVAVVAGVLLFGMGFILEGLFPVFAVILLAQVVWGLGATFADGAEQAWISQEVGEEHVGQIFARAAQLGLLGGLAGAILSAILGAIRLNVPVIAGGATIVALGLTLWAIMPEEHFQPDPAAAASATWRALGATAVAGLRAVQGSVFLRALFGIELWQGLASEGLDRLSTPHLLHDFHLPGFIAATPVALFTIFTIAETLLGLVAVEIVKRRVDVKDLHRVVGIMIVVAAIQIGCIALFALSGNLLLACSAFVARTIIGTGFGPLRSTLLTRAIDARVRATVLSLFGQTNALGQIVGGPPVGVLGMRAGLRAALVAVAALLTPTLAIYARLRTALARYHRLPI